MEWGPGLLGGGAAVSRLCSLALGLGPWGLDSNSASVCFSSY